MKKIKQILAAMTLVVVAAGSAEAQIPNPDFEGWTSVSQQKPSGWGTYGKAIRVGGFKSPAAVKLMRDYASNDGPGAVVYGDPEQNFAGGIPFNGRPDSAVGFFRCNFVAGDTGWFLVFLKRKGSLISQDIFYLTGNDSSHFVRKAFAIRYSDTGRADTLVIGVASTNPDSSFVGSWVVADSLHFTGGSVPPPFPNSGFENWTTVSYDQPDNWYSSNVKIPAGLPFAVTKSSDHVFGQYAVRIQNVNAGGGNFIQGYVMAGRQGPNGPLPGFAVSGKDSVLYCNYKCNPKNGDTVMVGVMLFHKDTMIGMGSLLQWNNVDTWTQAAIKLNYWYPKSSVADSGVIYCAAFQGGDIARGESVLYVDGLRFNAPMNRVTLFSRLPSGAWPNPAVNAIQIALPLPFPGASVQLQGIDARLVSPEYQISADQKTIFINTSNLPAGTWIYRIESGNHSTTGTLLIER